MLEDALPLSGVVDKFLQDIRTFRKPLTYQKYEHVLELFAEHVAPISDVRQITGEDVKTFLAWQKSKGFDVGTTLYTDRVILHNCPLVFPSPKSHLNYRFLHDRCKEIAARAGLNPAEWHLHRFRDTAATRWLRAGIDVRTVQIWLDHESLATTQKYLEPSRDTERKLNRLKLPF